jgi:hypothetical protein
MLDAVRLRWIVPESELEPEPVGPNYEVKFGFAACLSLLTVLVWSSIPRNSETCELPLLETLES